MATYKVLTRQSFEEGDYSIVPIRMQDRYEIMNWRNEQLYHLRQSKRLTQTDQDHYFQNVVSTLFNKEKPDQILFSYLNKLECIGYGGLVHINWIDKNAEVSFIMNTKLEDKFFHFHWSNFLLMIEKVGFEELDLHKLFIYAFDLRPHLYDVLSKNNYFKDAVLRDHCFFEGGFKDVLIYSKINNP